ncbi:MAG: NAD(P)-binding domain-containing protein [Planctomycetes bacterium]|nr:NAD(P)-binding domain-containing protein [Planctomycetota bacterium]
MSWALLLLLTGALAFALAVVLRRREELVRLRRTLAEREHRRDLEVETPTQFQHPVVDLSRCMGCATCVAVCPETGVLEIVHGQATVVNGAGCLGISACERECPVGAITVTIKNYEKRPDIPALEPSREAVGVPGVFLAGEVTAQALIRPAIEAGSAVAREVAARVASAPRPERALDLVVVGAGPAGLACALEARQQGLRCVVLDREQELGGTVATYPRRKLVLTQPVDLPGHGRLTRTSYEKEELIDLWHELARDHGLEVHGGREFTGLAPTQGGGWRVETRDASYEAPYVCLAIGRRGTPRKLDVPGEELPKVCFSLLDARAYSGRRILVVGGGDSAVEAALALAEQPGNEVTLSYRRGELVRLKARNLQRFERSVAAGKLRALFHSDVLSIEADRVHLRVRADGVERVTALANDDVFVLIGGTPPVELLERAGVSFDPSLRPPPRAVLEEGTGIVNALAAGLALTALTLAFALWNLDYYGLATHERPTHDKHAFLRPGQGLGLWLGVGAALLVVVNLAYLLRRSPRVRFAWGSLRAWMTSHVATGILAFLFALLHAAMSPRDSLGGHALTGLGVLLVTGAVGRYLYAFVPRAANGRELELREVRARLAALVAERDGGFEERARAEVLALVEGAQWRAGLWQRFAGLFGETRRLRAGLQRIELAGLREGVSAERVHQAAVLARRAHRTALMAAHFEDLRALLGTWRYLHRWVALLMVLLVALHVVYALSYGSLLGGGA